MEPGARRGLRQGNFPRAMGVMWFVIASIVFFAATGTSGEGGSLDGTAWQLVKFQSGDGMAMTPANKALYTLAFERDGRAAVRIDCNRGRGAWKPSKASSLVFGPLALTRAMCPKRPLTDRWTQDIPRVRSYVIKNGHLFLSLMADDGTYEFEPLNDAASPTPKTSKE
jgi:para-nitrobenzyl esterase